MEEKSRSGWVCKFAREFDEFEIEENPNLIGMGECPYHDFYVHLDFCAQNCKHYKEIVVVWRKD
jgi:hypothetical protein